MRIANIELQVKTDTMPVVASGVLLDRVVTGRTIMVDVRMFLDDEDLKVIVPEPGSNWPAELERRLKAAFEGEVVRKALLAEAKRGRLIGGEV